MIDSVIVNKIKEDLLTAAKRAYNRGIQTGSGGNFSARIPGENLMIIKASGFSFIDCSKENLVITDFNGNIVQGEFKPSREVRMHGELYIHFPKIRGIVHTHSPWAITWSLTKKNLEQITYHSILKLGEVIPTFAIEESCVPEEGLMQIVTFLKEHKNTLSFLLLKHGIVAFGKDVIEAEHNAELVEETAQVAWIHKIGTQIGFIAK